MILPNSFLLLSTASLLACSTLVGADFDDRNVADATSGGKSTTSGGQSALGGQNTGGSPASGGASTRGGSSNGSGGTPLVGSGGTPAGGSAGQSSTGGNSGGTATTTGGSSVGLGGAGSGGAGGEPEAGAGGFGGAGGEAQGGVGGQPEVAGAGGEAGGAGAPAAPPLVVLNEVKGQGSGDDYVEIYNRGPGALNLEGYGLSDQNNTFVFPSGATIAEGGHVLLLLGQTVVNGNFTCFTPNPCFHATWGISQNGETVYFRGRQNEVLDLTPYPNQTGAGALTNDQTWGRLPDGSGTFRATRPTPEATNLAPP